jgi:mRNA interferase MazF
LFFVLAEERRPSPPARSPKRVIFYFCWVEKDFEKWNMEKQKLEAHPREKFCYPREIWWCAFGVNIGREQDGKGMHFERPVLILRGFNVDSFFGVALTSQEKKGEYYFPIGVVAGKAALANLSQVRIFDVKRLRLKIMTLDIATFEQVKSACRQTLFPDSFPEIGSHAELNDPGEAEALVDNNIILSE